ncbi:kinase-like domain-containing protein [Talaromyces proteolyticus]|uniref:Kinase-like domain-containing protein n=1 Tax=Talaromyces proteolyticus TaxID=1131652 RepID=A0AAD4PX90_9EURO|nr:kinase-like domain-containing protein [Talaromyces proteolyticus]KAH8699072.1 kinase-like domain-containing protein [Talaromyces proteolyticus]
MPSPAHDDMGHESTALPGNRPGENTASQETSHQSNGDHNGAATTKEITAAKQYKASVVKRISARSPILQPSPVYSLRSQISNLRLDGPEDEEDVQSSNKSEQALFGQVLNWLRQEQTKRNGADSGAASSDGGLALDEKRHSFGSEKGLALDQLEKILQLYAPTKEQPPHRQLSRKHRHGRSKGLRRGSGSESDYYDEMSVPSVDAALDNTKTLGYTGGTSTENLVTVSDPHTRGSREKNPWLVFKAEILRLAHTLRLKGWRSVDMESCGDIEVTRLSGALTNAVYMVKPPKFVRPNADRREPLVPRRPPPKLLLRIYGPQVEHLIDREAELQVLRRLGRKNIGPRVLGTFNNGRFEEYFNAHPLTPKELRIPATSRQIAKRMRELHDGIELLEEERRAGPFVFRNWDKWVDRCEQVISWLDNEILSDRRDRTEPWRKRGFVCGVPWATFRKAVENYRIWLTDHLGGVKEINRHLVFAHNDTQYGNLLRLEPEEESPLLLPANSHKQLVVIDFEYASANTRGLEFANHFTEWCYNYHDAEYSWACNTRAYPTPEEQHRFISAYVSHHSQVGSTASPLATPDITPASISTPRLAPFSLDAPAVPSLTSASTTSLSLESDRMSVDESHDSEIQHLMRQTRVWRVANSAQWVAWGIVQAKVPALEEQCQEDPTSSLINTTNNINHNETEGDVDDSESEFDYLAYAQDRALFFWADVLSMGLIREDELPGGLLEIVKSKVVNY